MSFSAAEYPVVDPRWNMTDASKWAGGLPADANSFVYYPYIPYVVPAPEQHQQLLEEQAKVHAAAAAAVAEQWAAFAPSMHVSLPHYDSTYYLGQLSPAALAAGSHAHQAAAAAHYAAQFAAANQHPGQYPVLSVAPAGAFEVQPDVGLAKEIAKNAKRHGVVNNAETDAAAAGLELSPELFFTPCVAKKPPPGLEEPSRWARQDGRKIFFHTVDPCSGCCRGSFCCASHACLCRTRHAEDSSDPHF